MTKNTLLTKKPTSLWYNCRYKVENKRGVTIMGLLFHHLSSEFQVVAENVYQRHFDQDKKLEQEYDAYRKQKMFEDILHNLSFLEVSYNLEDDKLFHEYAIWLLELMIYLMPDLSTNRIKEHMITHYTLLEEELKQQLKDPDYQRVKALLDDAKTTTLAYQTKEPTNIYEEDKYRIHKKNYLAYLMDGDSKAAIDYILELKRIGLPLEDIYVDILQAVMYQIGELWHENKITVDQEHYMTSITQVALSQFYDTIFSTKKTGQKLLSCSVGSELHEMGVRMVSDLFEYYGWDSTYLGAAIPENVLLTSIEKNKPDLLVLSVTMPQHLQTCQSLVESISKLENPPKIAVGGRAFSLTNEVWKKWPVDISTNNAKSLLKWAEKEFSL
jgi:methanogenic corrinoid protein MtbC1